MRYKIFRWYRELQAVDLTASEDESNEALNAHIAELHRIENEVMQVTVPLPYAQELCALRLHIAYVLNRLLSYKTSREGRLSHQRVGSS